jgi:hypothetical protein
MINYGLLTPSSNGDSIAICGSMLAFSSGLAVFICLIPQAAGQEGGKNVLAGSA